MLLTESGLDQDMRSRSREDPLQTFIDYAQKAMRDHSLFGILYSFLKLNTIYFQSSSVGLKMLATSWRERGFILKALLCRTGVFQSPRGNTVTGSWGLCHRCNAFIIVDKV